MIARVLHGHPPPEAHDLIELPLKTRTREKSYILIVDDNRNSLLALAAVLKDLQQHLILAESAKEALKQVLIHEFAVILMDAHMPIMSGFEAAKLIRARDKSAHTPIIFMTALYKDESNIFQGYSLGAVDYIFKPIDPLILNSKVKVFVELFSKSIKNHALENELKKRQLAEKRIKILTSHTQLILNSLGEGICGFNLQGTITFANPAAANLLGYKIGELLGQYIQNIFFTETPWKENPLYLALKGGYPYHTELTMFSKKDGSHLPVKFTATHMQATHTRRYGMVMTFRDVIDLKRAETLARQHQHQIKLAHGSRLSMAMEMASTLAHELNQPLATITNYSKGSIRRLEAKNPNLEEVLTALKKIAKQSQRAGEIIHNIKTFVGKGKLSLVNVLIKDLIEDAIALLEFELQQTNIDIQFSLENPQQIITVDKLQLEQVIINLLRNSIEAMREAKTMHPKIFIRSKLLDTHTLEISFIDNGPGFTQEISEQLLKKYFTTKSNGMGMGLAICRTIIEAHGGHIVAQPVPEGGACFHFTLAVR